MLFFIVSSAHSPSSRSTDRAEGQVGVLEEENGEKERRDGEFV